MSWYTWWTGRSGLSMAGKDDDQPKGALIVGVTGIVGGSLAKLLTQSDAPGGPWKVWGIARKPRPGWLEDCPVDYVRCDVLDEANCREMISPLKDVTHLFWVTWVNRSTEEENSIYNGKMFQNVLDVLLPNAPKLQHICLQTGGGFYIGPFEQIGKFQAHEPPFREDMPRLPVLTFYHTLEDILFETAKQKEGLTWSVHRPNVIFGFSPSSMMNILGGIAVYATICKYEGLPFQFPGNTAAWEQLGDVSDAELIAEQEIWASIEPSGKNQILNVTNGDVFRYKTLWRLLAEKFELEVAPYNGQSFNLQEKMKDKGPVWDAIVKENGLFPTRLEDVGNWWFVDVTLNAGTMVSSMNRSKRLGFFGFRDSEASALYWIDEMRNKKIIP